MRIFLSLAILLPALAALTWHCAPGDGRRDVRDYYFPIRSLTDGLVYEYQPVNNDSLSPAYWYYRSFLFRDSVFLTGTYYEYDLLPLQFIHVVSHTNASWHNSDCVRVEPQFCDLEN